MSSALSTFQAIMLGIQTLKVIVPIARDLSDGKLDWNPDTESEVVGSLDEVVGEFSEANIIKEEHAEVVREGIPLVVDLFKELFGVYEAFTDDED